LPGYAVLRAWQGLAEAAWAAFSRVRRMLPGSA